MAYTTYDTPAEFFNISTMPIAPGTPVDTTGAYSIASAAITLGCIDHATAANRFLTNLTAAQAHLTTGSTAQVIFGITDAIYQRFNNIKAADAANAPTKFGITRTGYTDETTGELVYNYAITCRVNAGTLVAVNS